MKIHKTQINIQRHCHYKFIVSDHVTARVAILKKLSQAQAALNYINIINSINKRILDIKC